MSPHPTLRALGPLTACIVITACGADTVSPQDPAGPVVTAAWGPETPNFNLEAILRGAGRAFGLVTFRQPNDGELVVHLGTWVRDLEPLHAYRLQRAVDVVLDGDCTSQGWLTLGDGLAPRAIVTDDRGTGEADLWRSLGSFPVGSTFDIHFRVIDDVSQAVVLESGCYQFTISQ